MIMCLALNRITAISASVLVHSVINSDLQNLLRHTELAVKTTIQLRPANGLIKHECSCVHYEADVIVTELLAIWLNRYIAEQKIRHYEGGRICRKLRFICSSVSLNR